MKPCGSGGRRVATPSQAPIVWLHPASSRCIMRSVWALIGMGGTMLVLWIMSLLILLIRKIFPYQADDSATKKG